MRLPLPPGIPANGNAHANAMPKWRVEANIFEGVWGGRPPHVHPRCHSSGLIGSHWAQLEFNVLHVTVRCAADSAQSYAAEAEESDETAAILQASLYEHFSPRYEVGVLQEYLGQMRPKVQASHTSRVIRIL